MAHLKRNMNFDNSGFYYIFIDRYIHAYIYICKHYYHSHTHIVTNTHTHTYGNTPQLEMHPSCRPAENVEDNPLWREHSKKDVFVESMRRVYALSIVFAKLRCSRRCMWWHLQFWDRYLRVDMCQHTHSSVLHHVAVTKWAGGTGREPVPQMADSKDLHKVPSRVQSFLRGWVRVANLHAQSPFFLTFLGAEPPSKSSLLGAETPSKSSLLSRLIFVNIKILD